MTTSYVVDNEKFHEEVLFSIRMVEKGLVGPKFIKPWDGLSKFAALCFKDHLGMPANRRLRFPREVTYKSLLRYRLQAYRRKLLRGVCANLATKHKPLKEAA